MYFCTGFNKIFKLRKDFHMKINVAHLKHPARSGGMINFAVFDAKSTNGNNSALLAELTQKARLNGLRIDQSALVFTQNGRTQFFGDKNLVDFLSTNWYPQWTHTLTV